MTAVAEARALLDQLMGGDRNAQLPSGAALPRKRKGGADGDGALLLPGKRSKSCYDKDICPLYCAWGVDVYELFVNTKSDIGPNPYTPEDSARQEYLGLPQHEKDRLGFEYMLFNKLSELVQSCDRTVQRNQEKLNKELQRQFQKRGGQDYVIDVDEAAVEQLCRNQITVEELVLELDDAVKRLASVKQKEEALSQTAAQEKETQQGKEAQEKDEQVKQEGNKDEAGETPVVKKEEDGMDSSQGDATQSATETAVKQEEAVPVKEEPAAVKQEPSGGDQTESDQPASEDKPMQPPSKDAMELGAIMLEKQALLVQVANILGQLGPIQEAVETQSKNLNHVKSDITTDKTVCDVSGNFMSARDADERIAAHYAGKQYVGWKLVRDKLGELIQKYGKFGPPRPGKPPMQSGGPAPHLPPSRGGHSAGGYGGRGDDRGGWRGGGDRGGPRDHRQGGGRRDTGGRWERGSGGGGGGGGSGRGGGGYDRGGYDRGGRRGNGGGGGYGRDGGGGNWGRR